MAGMLPAVESARRRRLHHSGSMKLRSGSRRYSFCLYATGPDQPHHTSNSLQRSCSSNGFPGGELVEAAREAKERLDEKFRSQRITVIKSHNNMESGGDHGERLGIIGNVQREVYSKKASRMFRWTKLTWKALNQKDCAICLDEFKTGDTVANLPCSHRFHWRCIAPWLESTPHCPCCRMAVAS